VQRATAQPTTGNFCGCGLAETPLGFQAGWSDCIKFIIFSLFSTVNYMFKGRIETNENRRRAGGLVYFLFIAHLEFRCKFLCT
jgi:hypothetical protein